MRLVTKRMTHAEVFGGLRRRVNEVKIFTSERFRLFQLNNKERRT